MKRLITMLGWVALLCTGCLYPQHSEVPATVRAENVFQLTTQLPSTIRRVAILPISSSQTENPSQLQSVLEGELNRSGRFEIISISPEQMALWTGRRQWRPEDALPADFFQRLASALDCDAILFAHLASYQPYKPIEMGWNIKLVDVHTGSIFWAADEVFDSANPDVAKSAAHYGGGHSGQEDAVLLSPRRFAQFTLAAIFETLPVR